MQTIDEQQLLQNLAYQAWLERGQPFGSPDVDWQRAQQLLQLYRPDIAKAQTAGPMATAGKLARKRQRPKQPEHQYRAAPTAETSAAINRPPVR